jgi:hypothetical protein
MSCDYSGCPLTPLAEELGLGAGSDGDLTGLELLLALGEGVFGLSLDEADLDRFSPPVPLPRPHRKPYRQSLVPARRSNASGLMCKT